MNRILAFLLIPLILVLPGCGALAQWQQSGKLDQVDQKLGEVTEGLVEIRKVQAAAREQADVDGDGKLSGAELGIYGSLLAAGMAELARRKFKALDGKHAQSAENRAELEARIEHEREKRKDAEVAMLKALLAEKEPPKA